MIQKYPVKPMKIEGITCEIEGVLPAGWSWSFRDGAYWLETRLPKEAFYDTMFYMVWFLWYREHLTLTKVELPGTSLAYEYYAKLRRDFAFLVYFVQYPE